MAKLSFVKIISNECLQTLLWLVDIGSLNGLVPTDDKPLPEPVSTQIFFTMWRHKASMS